MKLSNFSFIDINKNLNNHLFNVCKAKSFLSNLEKSTDFFNSSIWYNLHSTPQGHKIAYDFISELLGSKNVMIYDNNVPIFDSGDLYSKMNQCEKDFLFYIDSNKIKGIFKKGNFVFQYIGTTVTYYNGDYASYTEPGFSADSASVNFYTSDGVEVATINWTSKDKKTQVFTIEYLIDGTIPIGTYNATINYPNLGNSPLNITTPLGIKLTLNFDNSNIYLTMVVDESIIVTVGETESMDFNYYY